MNKIIRWISAVIAGGMLVLSLHSCEWGKGSKNSVAGLAKEVQHSINNPPVDPHAPVRFKLVPGGQATEVTVKGRKALYYLVPSADNPEGRVNVGVEYDGVIVSPVTKEIDEWVEFNRETLSDFSFGDCDKVTFWVPDFWATRDKSGSIVSYEKGKELEVVVRFP